MVEWGPRECTVTSWRECSGSDRLRQPNAMTLLYWEDILWARRRGSRSFDLLGNPNPGIAEYKRQIGAVERSYPVAIREHSRLAAWARELCGYLGWLRAGRLNDERGQAVQADG